MEFVAGKVAAHKKVREVEFIDAIPKSGSGKVCYMHVVYACGE